MSVFHLIFRTCGRGGLKLSAAGMAMLLAVGSSVHAEEEVIGAEEYRASCLSCHGVGGEGDGPMAEFLTVKPTDLTQIANNNDGHFPVPAIFEIIDGRMDLPAHGIRSSEGWEMPVWGTRYNAEMVEKLDALGPADLESVDRLVRGRVLELVYYLQAIQK